MLVLEDYTRPHRQAYLKRLTVLPQVDGRDPLRDASDNYLERYLVRLDSGLWLVLLPTEGQRQ